MLVQSIADPMPCRRHVLATFVGAAFAGPALVIAIPGEASPQDYGADADATLIALCTRFHRLHAEMLRESQAEWQKNAAYTARCDALEAVLHLQPVTVIGRRAKASVAHSALLWKLHLSDFDWREQADPNELLALDVLALAMVEG